MTTPYATNNKDDDDDDDDNDNDDDDNDEDLVAHALFQEVSGVAYSRLTDKIIKKTLIQIYSHCIINLHYLASK